VEKVNEIEEEIVGELRRLPSEILEKRRKVFGLAKRAQDLDLAVSKREKEIALVVDNEARDESGKLKGTVDSRKREAELRTYGDEVWKRLADERQKVRDLLEDEKFFLDHLEKRFSAARHLADLFSQKDGVRVIVTNGREGK
jgi:hypothetical protein